jgi:ABC-type bacteriocin/lantibiotic exporter with double-glycine peptidase domain
MNIRLGNTTELDTETLHGLQEAYLIANHMNWLKSLQKTYNETLSLSYHKRKIIILLNSRKHSPEVLLTIS